jgi:hypothetical protein
MHSRRSTPSLRYWRSGWLRRSICYGLPTYLEDLFEGQRNRSWPYWRTDRHGNGAPAWLRRLAGRFDAVLWSIPLAPRSRSIP